MVTGPVAVVYNLHGVEGLQLSPKTIGGIFDSKITKWDDAAIKADNPDAKLPSTPIQAFHRSDESGTSDNFTKFLVKTAGRLAVRARPRQWPAEAKGQGAKGSDGIASRVKGTDGAISYVELSLRRELQPGEGQGRQRRRRVRRADRRRARARRSRPPRSPARATTSS